MLLHQAKASFEFPMVSFHQVDQKLDILYGFVEALVDKNSRRIGLEKLNNLKA